MDKQLGKNPRFEASSSWFAKFFYFIYVIKGDKSRLEAIRRELFGLEFLIFGKDLTTTPKAFGAGERPPSAVLLRRTGKERKVATGAGKNKKFFKCGKNRENPGKSGTVPKKSNHKEHKEHKAAPAEGEVWTAALPPPASTHNTSLVMVEWFHSITALSIHIFTGVSREV